MIRDVFAIAIVAAFAVSAGTADAAAILNGSFTVLTNSDQVGIVNDSSGFSNLTLASGVPQSTDLFDIFSTSPVASQPISVSFNLTQTGFGAISALVNGAVSGLGGADDAASVTFAPETVPVPGYGTLSINLSSAAFASDYNGTVIATFTSTVPEPSSAALLSFGLACAALASASSARRKLTAQRELGLSG
jgi:hypothetical protein